jgi:hypothetical protein
MYKLLKTKTPVFFMAWDCPILGTILPTLAASMLSQDTKIFTDKLEIHYMKGKCSCNSNFHFKKILTINCPILSAHSGVKIYPDDSDITIDQSAYLNIEPFGGIHGRSWS